MKVNPATVEAAMREARRRGPQWEWTFSANLCDEWLDVARTVCPEPGRALRACVLCSKYDKHDEDAVVFAYIAEAGVATGWAVYNIDSFSIAALGNKIHMVRACTRAALLAAYRALEKQRNRRDQD